MPRKYPDQTKREAIGIPQIHDHISFTHYATAVHQPALRRWRQHRHRIKTMLRSALWLPYLFHSRRSVSKGCVYAPYATDGQCLRALRDRRSVSTRPTRPTVSVYAPYATDGQCLRDLRGFSGAHSYRLRRLPKKGGIPPPPPPPLYTYCIYTVYKNTGVL